MRSVAPLVLVGLALGWPLACSGKYAGGSGADASEDTAVPVPTGTGTGTPPLDGSMDSALSDATPPSPCASKHLFCDDFEDKSLGEAWDGVDDDATLLGLEASSACAHGSRCLRARLDPDPAHEASLRRTLRLPAGGLSVSMTVTLTGLVQTGTGGVGFMFVSVPLPVGTRFRHFNFFASSAGVAIQSAQSLEDGGGGGNSRTLAPFVTGPRRVKVVVVPRVGLVEATASVDDGAPMAVTLEGATSDQVTLVVGASYRPGITGGFVHVDDVVVDAL